MQWRDNARCAVLFAFDVDGRQMWTVESTVRWTDSTSH